MCRPLKPKGLLMSVSMSVALPALDVCYKYNTHWIFFVNAGIRPKKRHLPRLSTCREPGAA
jgi:hypothetical protein